VADAGLTYRFLRYEFKYILKRSLRNHIEREIRFFMQLDPFVQSLPEKKYPVRSLYFDDPHYTFYYEKIDGMLHRTKFRMRTYACEWQPDMPLFLERKGRHNNFVFKHRVLLDGACREAVGDGRMGELHGLMAADLEKQELYRQFCYDVYRKRITPVMLIDYCRRPYVSRYDYEFRLTFDDALRGTRTGLLHPPGGTALGRNLLPGHTILEIKFARHIPAWFHRILKTYELTRVSVSKYCLGMDRSGLVTKLE